MWTPPALASEARPLATEAWRVVESQSQVATMKLVDSLDEQAILEAELDRSKPAVPAALAGVDYLLATPFRYAPYPHGSRFRRARQRDGAFYCSERVETAIAEAAFYHLAFFLASPGTPLPRNPQERTAFRVPVQTARALDLTGPPLDRDHAVWTHPTDYGPCQDLADAARAGGLEAIRYEAVRDPGRGANLALLSPAALAARAPTMRETWRLLLRRDRVDAVREMPRTAVSFSLSDWSTRDPRIPASMALGPAQPR
ncbi:RES family NAD+ phosphorylase [Falsiroseomonas sp. CW058]|uniref:RES family NAD+ phosphorylase n=1 Tax=Falsiroseomonas sp. CW058 TaxID=3388664 RepID=UPI003D3113AB